MASFRQDNGKQGHERVAHTATGYECYSTFSNGIRQHEGQISLFIRHIIGDNGNPYIEIGLLGVHDLEKKDAINLIKQLLTQSGYSEEQSIENLSHNNSFFSKSVTRKLTRPTIIINDDNDSITNIIDSLPNLTTPEAECFIKEQEKIDNILFKSILHILGSELNKGPGGQKYAINKAYELAQYFKYGYC